MTTTTSLVWVRKGFSTATRRIFLLLAVIVLGWLSFASAQEVFIYDNRTTDTGYYQPNDDSTSATTDQNGNTITALIADDITPLAGHAGQSINKIYYSIYNNNLNTVTARVRLRFWNADGGAGYPGTFIAGFDIGPLVLPSGDSFLSYAPTNGMTVPSGRFWFGITFDNNTNTTGITAVELDNLGMDIYDPPTIGSSADQIFQTFSPGSFLGNNPSGSIFSYGTPPPANVYFALSVGSLGNQPPVANPQSISVKENHSTNITLTATDPESDPLTYAIVSSPANGTLTGSPPNVVYTPKTNFFGQDSFTFKANDGHSDSAAALVSISVIPTNGLVINPIWDSTITTDPNVAIITNTIISAIQVFESRIADPVTVSIQFVNTSSGLGHSSTYINTISYSSFFSALTAHSTTTNDTVALAHIAGGPNEPVTGGSSITLTLPNLRALGFSANPPGGTDSTISLNLSICNTNRISINPSKYDLMAVASHEIDEVLGTSSGLGQATINPPDLFRYSSTPGVRNYTTSGDDAYFSLDGLNDLARYNQNAGGDYGDWWSAPGDVHQPQVQDAYGTAGATPNLGVELTVLDVVGWNLASAVASVPSPQFTSIKRTNSIVTLTWSTVSGLNYQLLYTGNLTGTWTNLGSSITASGPTASFNETIGTNQRRFYRVELLNPPSLTSPAVNFAQVALPPPTLRTNVLLPSALPRGQ